MNSVEINDVKETYASYNSDEQSWLKVFDSLFIVFKISYQHKISSSFNLLFNCTKKSFNSNYFVKSNHVCVFSETTST